MAELARGLERFTLRPIARRLEAAIEDGVLRWVDEGLQYRLRFDALPSARRRRSGPRSSRSGS
ncbi:MAG: hypothetical protein KatS3mg063_1531 [Tepidiforma sp.]|uniref:hypothetical protein n=1 Tax=Tepidiforma sp. TaxID=2682230 RepID=UPI0021DBEB52|nr:hypothetical protein [Tepidiforma sp.]GIW15678.1 MAG: hypothetical protein KatS3mg063_1531 [Tepidiforma sp.]